MDLTLPDYGLWDVVFVNAAVFLIFAFSFARPRSGRDWRSFGAFSGFLVALFAEMYGFPFTVYLLSGWLGSLHPATNLFAHNNGHLWQTLLGWQGDPHGSWLHLLSNSMLGVGFLVLALAWPTLYRAQRSGQLARTGAYRLVRHPQYVGFIVILVAFMLQWPTIPTLLMFPVLVTMYVRLARREEREALAYFGEEYASYAARTPGFLPQPSWLARRRAPSPDTHEAFGDIS